MRRPTSHTVILAAAIALLIGVVLSAEFLTLAKLTPPPVPPLLSVEETMEITPTHYIDSVPPGYRERLRRVNPAARPLLYAVLQDNTKTEDWGSCVGMLEYIGQQEDIDKIHDLLFAQTGVVDSDRFRMVQNCLLALGALKGRGFKDAGAMLLQMAEPAYWDQAPFTLYPNPIPDYMTSSQEMALHALEAVIYSGDKAAAQSAAARLMAGIADPKERAIMQPWIDHAFANVWTWEKRR